jgi:hypothetical protein
MIGLVTARRPLGLQFTQSFLHFAYLQTLDLLSTLAFLLSGVQEGNPLVRFAMARAQDPLLGLLYVKIVALGLGLFCMATKRNRLLSRINLFFALLVAWNLYCLIYGLSLRAH